MRKVFYRVIIVLVILITVIGCSDNSKTSNSNQEANNSKQQEAKKPLLEDELYIGDISIGDSIKQIKNIYGEPNEKTIVHGQGDNLWIYSSEGFSVAFGNKIWGITVFEPFRGNTSRGIKIGSSLEELKKAYPDIRETHNVLSQNSNDMKYQINFEVKNNKVNNISLNKTIP